MNVSVIIPTYNRAHLLLQTIDSILNQTLKPTELIVVDDGSTDDTAERLEHLGEYIKYVRIENSGPCKARNVGVGISSSKWIAFCDSDDLWRQNKLEKQAELVAAAPQVQYCFTNFNFIKQGKWTDWSKFDDLPSDFWPASTTEVLEGHYLVLEPLYGAILKFQPIFVPGLLMTRTFFDEVGGFNEEFGRTATEDFEFTLRCAQKCPIGVSCEPLFGVRLHGEKHSGDPLANSLGQLKILDYALSNHAAAKQHSDSISQAQVVHRLDAAHAAFARKQFSLAGKLLDSVPKERKNAKTRVKQMCCKAISAFSPRLGEPRS